MEALHNFVSANGIMISAIILLVAYVFIALEKIPKVTIALFGGVLTILLGLISQDKMSGDALNPLYFINFIDFNVIFLLVSMMIIVSITAKTGVFSYIANNFLKMTKGHPIGFMQFMKYGVVVVLISLVLSSAYIYLRFLK